MWPKGKGHKAKARTPTTFNQAAAIPREAGRADAETMHAVASELKAQIAAECGPRAEGLQGEIDAVIEAWKRNRGQK